MDHLAYVAMIIVAVSTQGEHVSLRGSWSKVTDLHGMGRDDRTIEVYYAIACIGTHLISSEVRQRICLPLVTCRSGVHRCWWTATGLIAIEGKVMESTTTAAVMASHGNEGQADYYCWRQLATLAYRNGDPLQ